MKFLSTTAKLAGALGAAFLLSTAVANAAPANPHDSGPRIERHDTRGAPVKPQFAKYKAGHKFEHKDGRRFARLERHGFKRDCAKAHRHGRHEHHADKGARHDRGHGRDRAHDRRG